MRRPIIAGNWKMHGTKESVAILLESLVRKTVNFKCVDWVVLSPFVFLEQVQQALLGSNIAYGAQNLCNHSQGAYTGEISASMLKEFGCQYVLVGHSERRILYGETDKLVADKFAMAIDAALIPILCVGETLEERQRGRTLDVVTRQLRAVLNQSSIAAFSQAIIAYEPVWAIGTGEIATPEQAQEVHQVIRKQLSEEDQSVAKSLRILYGGSVRASNATLLFKQPDIDGGLIGGASLKADEFLQIGKACNN